MDPATVSALDKQAGYDVFADQSHRVFSSSIVFIVLPTIFVCLRFTSRIVSKATLWWDDWLILLSLLLSYGCDIGDLISTHHGLGQHLKALAIQNPMEAKDDALWFLQILYGYSLCYWLSVTTVKLSILVFYSRIFPTPRLRSLVLILSMIVMGVMVSGMLVIIFQCVPVHKFWNMSTKGHCININAFYTASGTINIILDFIIWIMPVPMLWRLRTTDFQKIILTSIFTCGGVVCIISIIRLVVLARFEAQTDITWDYVNGAVWAAAEPAAAICSACLTTLRPLFAMLFFGSPIGRRAKVSQDSYSSGSSRGLWRNAKESPGGNGRRFSRLDENPGEQTRAPWRNNTSVRGGRVQTAEEAIGMDEMEMPMKGIHVKTEVVWSSSDRIDYEGKLF